jgi:uncharacterized membrane protein YGL010W
MSAAVPPAMRARLDEYGELHRARGNEVCHFIGIPLITFGAGSMFGAVPLFALESVRITLADAVLLAIVAFYVSKARALGLVTALIVAGLVLAGQRVPFYFGLASFLVGWGFQFFGHAKYEKSSPAFLQNLVHLLVGPAWLVERALWRARLGRAAAQR